MVTNGSMLPGCNWQISRLSRMLPSTSCASSRNMAINSWSSSCWRCAGVTVRGGAAGAPATGAATWGGAGVVPATGTATWGGAAGALATGTATWGGAGGGPATGTATWGGAGGGQGA